MITEQRERAQLGVANNETQAMSLARMFLRLFRIPGQEDHIILDNVSTHFGTDAVLRFTDHIIRIDTGNGLFVDSVSALDRSAFKTIQGWIQKMYSYGVGVGVGAGKVDNAGAAVEGASVEV